MRKKTIRIISIGLFLLLTASLNLHLSAQDDPPLLKLPLRCPPESPPVNLVAADLSLQVNGTATGISSLLSRERSLSEQRGRNRIVLAFCSGHPGPGLRPFLDSFYRRILAAGDELLLCSPLTVIPVATDEAGRRDFPDEAFERLSEDLQTFDSMLQALEQKIRAIAGKFPKNSESANWLRHFTVYEREFCRIEQHLMSAILNRLADSFNRWGTTEPAPWLICLDEGRPLSDRVAWPFADRSKLGSAAAARVQELAGRLESSQDPVWGELADELLLRRVSLIAFSIAAGTSGASSSYLDTLCRRSGVACRPFTDATSALTRIESYRDRLYEIVYPFDGQVGDKHYRLIAAAGIPPPVHPLRLKAQVFQNLAPGAANELAISQLGVQAGDIVLRIEGLRPDGQEATVQVHVRVADEAGKLLLDQQKEVQARQSVLDIRLPFPADLRGYYSLNVEAREAGGGRSARKTVYGKISDK